VSRGGVNLARKFSTNRKTVGDAANGEVDDGEVDDAEDDAEDDAGRRGRRRGRDEEDAFVELPVHEVDGRLVHGGQRGAW